MKKHQLLLTFLLIVGSLPAFSQLSVSYYHSSNEKLGVAYNFNEKIWAETRVYGNTFFESFTPEFALFYNVVHKEKHSVYVGAGGVVNGYNGLILPVGLQVRPLEKFKALSLHIELLPLVDLDFDPTYILQTSFGFRYSFESKSK